MKKIKKETTKKTSKPKAKTKKLKTDKQKKLLDLISVNLGKKKPLTMEEMMLKAGYSKSSAKQQSSLVCAVKESDEFTDYVSRLEKHRDKIIDRMEALVDIAQYNELSMTLSRIENIIVLAQGKPTSRVDVLSDDEKEKLDNLLKDNS